MMILSKFISKEVIFEFVIHVILLKFSITLKVVVTFTIHVIFLLFLEIKINSEECNLNFTEIIMSKSQSR